MLMLACDNASAQKYAFAHYDTGDGLIQSQVNNFYQDNSHRLWIATLGGICRFDGSDYYTISKANGLANNFAFVVYADSKGTAWVGTNKGLSSIKKQTVYNYPVPTDANKAFVSNIAEERNGTIWVIMSNHLYRVNGRKLETVSLPDSLDVPVSCITTDKAGSLYAAFVGKGIYQLNSNKWNSFAPVNSDMGRSLIFKIQFDKFNGTRLFLLTVKGLFIASNGAITPCSDFNIDRKEGPFISFEQDYENNLWIGTQRGAWFISKQKTIHFTAANGLTNIAVSDIYCDGDHNLWLGTQGSGMYRYEGAGHVIYDQLQNANATQVVMSIARDRQHNILLGTAGNGLIKYSNGVLSNFWMPATNAGTAIIQSLYTDNDKNVWIGTDHLGIWKYDGVAFNLIKGTETRSINYITTDGDNTLWIATPQGVYYYQNNSMTFLQGISSFTSAILPLGKDSVLVGTQDGLKLVVNKKLDTRFKPGVLPELSVMCMLRYQDKILLGTDDGGLYVWDRQNGLVKNYTVKDGFNANTIYSLTADDKGGVWVGTGRGINRLTFKPRSMACIISQAGISKDLMVETNQNASFYDADKVFFGTVKGLAVLNTNDGVIRENAPHILIRAVKLLVEGEKETQLENNNPSDYLKLSAGQNHLLVTFKGVYLKKPEGVTYQYRLTGLEREFSTPVNSDAVDYPSLPPGKYTFEVKALSPEEKISSGIATFKFEITPPFYQQTIFRVLGVILLVLIGFALQYFVHRAQTNKKLAHETLKREEKQKLRQQTAEDFHDDLGNKLTRITVLSDVLHTKLDDKNTEQKNLVEQIQQNAVALYNGTKDILWALDPKSDNLYETLVHIRETGVEMFQDVNINFSFEGIADNFNQIRLPMEYSRNITMIFKELLTNILKHAGARNVVINVEQPINNHLTIKITDDGRGFDEHKLKRGHGLVNIKARATRIDAMFSIKDGTSNGTIAELQVKLV